jgi:predicted DNA-binding protein
MSVYPLRIENNIDRQLERLSRELKRPKSWIIRDAIKEYIQDTIDYEIALSRLKDKNDEILTSREFKNKYLHDK